MKTKTMLIIAMAFFGGCSRQTAQQVKDGGTAGSIPDQQAIQEIRDLGLTPETALQVLREDLKKDATAMAGQVAPGPPAAQPAQAPPAPEPATAANSAPGENSPAAVVIQSAPAGNGGSPEPTTAPETAASSESAAPAVASTQPVIPNVSYFNSVLSPYGNWIDVPPYGMVWQPYTTVANPGWQPYCQGGYWNWTDAGWYWNSTYNWGWAPFHYGRWCWTPGYRWCWTPDTCWAPAWVCWRSTRNCFGWAPLPPGTSCQSGAGRTWDADDSMAAANTEPSVSSFTFVPRGHFRDHDLDHAMVPRSERERTFANSSTVNHSMGMKDGHVMNSGVPRADVEQASGSHVPALRIVRQTQWPEAGPAGTPGGRVSAERISPRTATMTRQEDSRQATSAPRVNLNEREVELNGGVLRQDPERRVWEYHPFSRPAPAVTTPAPAPTLGIRPRLETPTFWESMTRLTPSAPARAQVHLSAPLLQAPALSSPRVTAFRSAPQSLGLSTAFRSNAAPPARPAIPAHSFATPMYHSAPAAVSRAPAGFSAGAASYHASQVRGTVNDWMRRRG